MKDSIDGQCQSHAANGRRCNARAIRGKTRCFFHDPALAEQRTAARRRGGEHNRVAILPDDTAELPLRNSHDAAELIGKTINDLRRGKLDPKVATAVGYLTTVGLRAIQVGDLEQRLAALEGRGPKPNSTQKGSRHE